MNVSLKNSNIKQTAVFAYFFLALIFQAGFQAGAEEERENLKFLLEFSPDAVIQNEPFTFNIIVNHSAPDEVYIEPPDFHDAFRIERLRVETRFVFDSPREGNRWTVFEFLLTAVEAGAQRLDPFQITVFEETVMTNPISIQVREENPNAKISFAWFGANGRSGVYPVRMGDSREFVLRVTNWEKTAYPAIQLRIEAPQNAIIEELPLSKNDRDTGIILRLQIIPLDENPVNINKQIVYYEKNPLEIPPLQISVLPAAVIAQKDETGTTSYSETELPQTAPDTHKITAAPLSVSFSVLMDNNKNIFFPLRTGVDACISEAAFLWQQERYAAALAVLRHGESSLVAGYAVRTARIICENAVGLPSCPNELWLPRCPLLFIFIFSAVFSVFLFFIKKICHVSMFFRTALFCVSAAAFSALLFSYNYGETRAVLGQCAAYPIPEETVKPAVYFMEGEPARIRSKSGGWVYVEALIQNAHEKSGWIKKENMNGY
jgi:hypothetical protein